MVGRLHARGVGFWPQLLACAVVRLVHNAATIMFFIWVIAGGRRLRGNLRRDRPPLRDRGGHGGRAGADVREPARMGSSRARCRCWCTGAGLCAWPREEEGARTTAPGGARSRRQCGESLRFPLRIPTTSEADPRAVAPAAAVASAVAPLQHRVGPHCRGFGLARGSLAPVEFDPAPLRAGLLFAAILATGAFVFAIVQGSTRRPACPSRRAAGAHRHLAPRPPPAPAGPRGLRGGRSAGFERSCPRSRRRRCSRRSPPRTARGPARALIMQGERDAEAAPGHPRCGARGGARIEVFRPSPAARPLTLSARLIDWALGRVGLALALTYPRPIVAESRARPRRGRPGRRRRSS